MSASLTIIKEVGKYYTFGVFYSFALLASGATYVYFKTPSGEFPKMEVFKRVCYGSLLFPYYMPRMFFGIKPGLFS